MNKLERVFINNWEDKHLKQHICQVNRLLFLLRLEYNLWSTIQNTIWKP